MINLWVNAGDFQKYFQEISEMATSLYIESMNITGQYSVVLESGPDDLEDPSVCTIITRVSRNCDSHEL